MLVQKAATFYFVFSEMLFVENEKNDPTPGPPRGELRPFFVFDLYSFALRACNIGNFFCFCLQNCLATSNNRVFEVCLNQTFSFLKVIASDFAGFLLLALLVAEKHLCC